MFVLLGGLEAEGRGEESTREGRKREECKERRGWGGRVKDRKGEKEREQEERRVVLRA